MSDVLKVSSTDLKTWLERETGSIFIPVHTKAQKLFNDMHKGLESLSEASKALLDNSGKEIEKRNMKTYGRARALNKLARLFVDRLRQLRFPDKVTYDTLNSFIQDTQKAFLATEVDIRNWFPRISPFFILDRRKFLAIFEKNKLQLKDLEGFLAKEYVKTKTLEDTFTLVDRVSALENSLKDLNQRKARTETERATVEKEIAETQRKMESLKTMGSTGQLSQTGTEIEALSLEVKQSLHHLQKPFVKLQSLVTHGSGSGLTPQELEKLNQYLENPFEAFSTEEQGYPLLKEILEKMRRAISEDKLKLKPEKARKAEQTIDNILKNDSLTNLHHRAKNAMSRKTQLQSSEEVAATQRHIAQLHEQAENSTRRRGVIETEEMKVKRTYAETGEKIRSLKNEIEKNVFSFMGKKVIIP